MGRGRAKAKQTKVARDLKYRTHETDFGALAQELHGGSGTTPAAEHGSGCGGHNHAALAGAAVPA